MGLFSKKSCSICGGDIGLFGNTKVSDGNICKNCHAKLSPYFRAYSSATVSSIEEQLRYREANQAEAAAFTATTKLGSGRTKLLIDENTKKFCITSATDLAKTNPDIMNLSDVIDCVMDIDCSEREQMTKNAEGKSVSYEPKRYTYRYDFYMDVKVNNPYFDKIRFQVNDNDVEMESIVTEPRAARVASARPVQPAQPTRPVQPAANLTRPAGTGVASNLTRPAGSGVAQTAKPLTSNLARPAQAAQIAQAQAAKAAQTAQPARPIHVAAGSPDTVTVTKPVPEENAEYQAFVNECEQIRAFLLGTGEEAVTEATTETTETVETAPAAQEPKAAVVCSCCGATTIPDENGCCEYCGSKVEA